MEYKRLTEKTRDCFQYDLKDFKHKIGEFGDYDAIFAYSMAVKRLGELEDKIENGTLVELPCKVGDTGFMKTEQEQIEQIEKVLKDSVAEYKHLKKKGVCYCYAETLINHGYGDVSEYKAEIERLKAENEKLRNEKWNAQDDLDCYCDEMPNKIKQAKIDVLNKVKERAVGLAAIETYHICNLIDELIKEIRAQWKIYSKLS